jgi:hypothetical protein
MGAYDGIFLALWWTLLLHNDGLLIAVVTPGFCLLHRVALSSLHRRLKDSWVARRAMEDVCMTVASSVPMNEVANDVDATSPGTGRTIVRAKLSYRPSPDWAGFPRHTSDEPRFGITRLKDCTTDSPHLPLNKKTLTLSQLPVSHAFLNSLFNPDIYRIIPVSL